MLQASAFLVYQSDLGFRTANIDAYYDVIVVHTRCCLERIRKLGKVYFNAIAAERNNSAVYFELISAHASDQDTEYSCGIIQSQ